MFPSNYFAPTYFPPTYFADPPAPVPGAGGVYFSPSYFAGTYFAPSYFPGIPTGTPSSHPDLLSALYSYLVTAPTIIPLFSVGFGVGGFGTTGYGGSVKVWYEVADASAYPPFLTIHGYTEPLPGESLEDQEILVSLLITTNSIDEARTVGRAVRDAIDTPNQSPTSLGRPPFTFVGGTETGLMRDASNPERRSGYGKGGTFVYVEQIDYRIWVSPEQ